MLQKNQALGSVVRAGVDPRVFVQPEPVFTPFEVHEAIYAVRPQGRPSLVCVGKGPLLSELEGFVLIVTFRRGLVVLGGVHPWIRSGSDAPFRQFFELSDVARSVFLTISTIGNLDVSLLRADGKALIANYIFRFIAFPRLFRVD